LWAVIAFVLLIAVAAANSHSVSAIFSPGALNAQAAQDSLGGVSTHAELSGKCGACHAPPWSPDTMADRCLSCHEGVARELGNPHDLHGMAIAAGQAVTCTAGCHTEHKGKTADLTLVNREHFSKDKSSFSMQAHQKDANGLPFRCVDCHPVSLDKFEVALCQSCHQGIDGGFTRTHVNTFGTDCLKCHDGVDTYGKSFDHDKVKFVLLGKHDAVACADCHQGQKTISQLQASPQTCYACHRKDDKHLGAAGTDCVQCHSASDWKRVTFDHVATRYPLTGKHVNVACLACHTNNLYRGTPQDCNSCHKRDDKHNGSLGPDCAGCHSAIHWRQVGYGHSAAATAYPLTGKHVNVACVSCHPNGVYIGAPKDCNSCHKKDDKHKGAQGLDCAQCHGTADWKQVSEFHSQANTPYPLAGRHVGVSCADCHPNNVFKSTPKDCNSCHQKDDKHKGALGLDCSRCHNVSDWRQVKFDHSQANTRYPLTGKHVTAACSACHINNVYKGTTQDCNACHQQKDKHRGALGRNCSLCHNTADWKQTSYNHSTVPFPLTGKHVNVACSGCHTSGSPQSTSQSCYACHQQRDKHLGSYGQICSQCHNTTDWKQATVNHALTAFPLTGAHIRAACNDCHVSGIYKGTAKTCYACHRPDDRHAGSYGQNCSQCHNTTAWKPSTFNHSSVWALTGRHTSVACNACHINGVFPNTPTTCYACHKSKDRHNGANGQNCASCHNTTSWASATVNHAQTAFPLTGRHTSVACASCHKNGVYKGTPSACSACHRDEHRGRNGTDCARCHNTRGF